MSSVPHMGGRSSGGCGDEFGRRATVQAGWNEAASGGTGAPGSAKKKKNRNQKILMILLILCALVLAAIIGVFLYTGTDSYRVSRQLSLGDRFLEEKEYDRAVAAYESAVQIDPKSVDSNLKLATAHTEYAQDQVERAREVQSTDEADLYVEYITRARTEVTYATETVVEIEVLVQEQESDLGEEKVQTVRETVEYLRQQNEETQEEVNSMPDAIDSGDSDLAADEATADAARPEETDLIALYEQYVEEVLIPEYGVAEDQELSAELNSETANDQSNITWHERSGIMGEDFADLDEDGIEEMLVYSLRVELFSENEWTDWNEVNSYVNVYRYQEGEVQEVCEYQLSSDGGIEILLIGTGIMELDGQTYLYVQEYDRGVFSDGTMEFYKLCTLQEDGFETAYVLGCPYPGSDMKEYTVRIYARGVLQEEILVGADGNFDLSGTDAISYNYSNLYEVMTACWSRLGVDVQPEADPVSDMPDYRKTDLVRGGFSYRITAGTGYSGSGGRWYNTLTSQLVIDAMHREEE